MSLHARLATAAVLATLAGCVAAPAPDPVPVDAGRALAARRFDEAERLMVGGRFAQAVPRLQEALAADPFHYRSHHRLGVCYYELGEYELEISEYRKCVAINPSYAPAWRSLGHASVSADDLALAREAYYRYLALTGHGAPGAGPVLYNLALVEQDLGNEEASKVLLGRYRSTEGVLAPTDR